MYPEPKSVTRSPAWVRDQLGAAGPLISWRGAMTSTPICMTRHETHAFMSSYNTAWVSLSDLGLAPVRRCSA